MVGTNQRESIEFMTFIQRLNKFFTGNEPKSTPKKVLVPATRARRLTDRRKQELAQETCTEMQKYFADLIEMAIKRGEYSIHHNYYPNYHVDHPEIITWLKSEGYMVIFAEDGKLDISW
jgi:hypothetical protein